MAICDACWIDVAHEFGQNSMGDGLTKFYLSFEKTPSGPNIVLKKYQFFPNAGRVAFHWKPPTPSPLPQKEAHVWLILSYKQTNYKCCFCFQATMANLCWTCRRLRCRWIRRTTRWPWTFRPALASAKPSSQEAQSLLTSGISSSSQILELSSN